MKSIRLIPESDSLDAEQDSFNRIFPHPAHSFPSPISLKAKNNKTHQERINTISEIHLKYNRRTVSHYSQTADKNFLKKSHFAYIHEFNYSDERNRCSTPSPLPMGALYYQSLSS